MPRPGAPPSISGRRWLPGGLSADGHGISGAGEVLSPVNGPAARSRADAAYLVAGIEVVRTLHGDVLGRFAGEKENSHGEHGRVLCIRRLEGNAPGDGVKAYVPVMLEDPPALILPAAGRVVIVRKRIPLER